MHGCTNAADAGCGGAARQSGAFAPFRGGQVSRFASVVIQKDKVKTLTTKRPTGQGLFLQSLPSDPFSSFFLFRLGLIAIGGVSTLDRATYSFPLTLPGQRRGATCSGALDDLVVGDHQFRLAAHEIDLYLAGGLEDI